LGFTPLLLHHQQCYKAITTTITILVFKHHVTFIFLVTAIGSSKFNIYIKE
jgi:hypothetical protein